MSNDESGERTGKIIFLVVKFFAGLALGFGLWVIFLMQETRGRSDFGYLFEGTTGWYVLAGFVLGGGIAFVLGAPLGGILMSSYHSLNRFRRR